MILMLTASLGFTACSEESGVEDPYANWEERNQHYIDSIAAKQNPGEWKIIRNYKYQPDDNNLDANLSSQFDVNDYVYAKILASAPAESTVSPLFQDTVYVHYRGKMINGTVFDQSFYTDEFWNPLWRLNSMSTPMDSVRCAIQRWPWRESLGRHTKMDGIGLWKVIFPNALTGSITASS